jgi:hypothetical protein
MVMFLLADMWLNEEDPLREERVFVSQRDTAYFTVIS